MNVAQGARCLAVAAVAAAGRKLRVGIVAGVAAWWCLSSRSCKAPSLKRRKIPVSCVDSEKIKGERRSVFHRRLPRERSAETKLMRLDNLASNQHDNDVGENWRLIIRPLRRCRSGTRNSPAHCLKFCCILRIVIQFTFVSDKPRSSDLGPILA